MSFDEDPADNKTELDLCIEEIKELQNKLAARDAEIKSQEEQVTDLYSTIGFMQRGIDQWKKDCEGKDAEIERLKYRIRDTEQLKDSVNFEVGYLENITAANPKRTFLIIKE
jgi:peptidoglycan hydrolase CwlO-like protein